MIVRRWETDKNGVQFNYDFWYQPRHNAMISSEWAAPRTFQDGFNLQDVAEGKYGHSIHFWDLAAKRVTQSIDLGEQGLIPLEVRWQHNPDSETGFVGAALSSAMARWYRQDGQWHAAKIIQVEPKEAITEHGWPAVVRHQLAVFDMG